jgi:hypothetical protein
MTVSLTVSITPEFTGDLVHAACVASNLFDDLTTFPMGDDHCVGHRFVRPPLSMSAPGAAPPRTFHQALNQTRRVGRPKHGRSNQFDRGAILRVGQRATVRTPWPLSARLDVDAEHVTGLAVHAEDAHVRQSEQRLPHARKLRFTGGLSHLKALETVRWESPRSISWIGQRPDFARFRSTLSESRSPARHRVYLWRSQQSTRTSLWSNKCGSPD